jgi:transketolase
LGTAVEAAEVLEKDGISVRVLSMHTLKPLDLEAILKAARETGAMATLEEHSVVGGLGGAVAEVLAECDEPKVPFRRLGLPSAFSGCAGSQEYLRNKHGLSSVGIVESIRELLKTNPRDKRCH